MGVEVKIIRPESFFNLTLLELFNFYCETIEDLFEDLFLKINQNSNIFKALDL